MLGRVARLAPGAELHAARALARDHVRPGSAKTRILEGLVGIDGDLISGSGLDHAELVLGHRLALVPCEAWLSVGAAHPRTGRVRDIAGLDRVPAEPLHLGKGGIQLLLVVEGVAAGFVVADDFYALLASVGRDAFEIEIGIGSGEAVVPAGAEPVAVPTQVPALDQHPAEAMLRREIDVFDGVFGRGAVLRTRAPGLQVQVHLPPDADIFHRLEPADVAERIGLVQVQDQAGLHQIPGAVGDLQRTPRRGEGGGQLDGRIGQTGGQEGLEPPALDAPQVHAGIVGQGRLVDRDMQTVIGAHRQRGLGHTDRVDPGAVVEILLAVPFEGRDPPGGAGIDYGELGQFIADVDGLEIGLVGDFVSEAEAVVVETEYDRHPPLEAIPFREVDPELGVVVSDEAALAPGLLPAIVMQGGGVGGDDEIAFQLGRVGQQETEPGRGDHRPPQTADAVFRAPLAVDRHRYRKNVSG